jgi:hypothetical protein
MNRDEVLVQCLEHKLVGRGSEVRIMAGAREFSSRRRVCSDSVTEGDGWLHGVEADINGN